MTTDSFWNDVVLNMRMEAGEGEGGLLMFTDDKEHTFTAQGGATLSTEQKRYGSAALKLVRPGGASTGTYLKSPNSQDFAFGLGSFTVEAWIYLLPGGNYGMIVDSLDIGESGTRYNAYTFGVDSDRTLITFQSTVVLIKSPVLPTETWIHVALCRETSYIENTTTVIGAETRMFINGVQVEKLVDGVWVKATSTNLVNLVSPFAHIGTISNISTNSEVNFNGYIDDLRITRAARYTADFTPPEEIYNSTTPPVLPPEDPTVEQNLAAKVLPWNPDENIREKWSWATSHISTWTAEERTELRFQPSLSVDYKLHILSDERLNAVLEFYKVNQSLPVRVPMWSSPVQLRNLVAGQTSFALPADSPARAFLAPTAEVIFWKDPTRYEVQKVLSLGASTVTLESPLLNAFHLCYLMPCLLGYFSGTPVTRSLGSRRAWNFTFDCHSVYIAEHGYTNEDSYFAEKPLQSTDFGTISQRESDIVESPLGVRRKIDTEEVTRQSWTCAFTANGLAESVLLKQKLSYFRGKARRLRYPFTNLTHDPAATHYVSLSEDSVTFIHSPRLRCTATVGLVENTQGELLLKIPGTDFYYFTLYDWDAPLFGTNPVCELPRIIEGNVVQRLADGHVTYKFNKEGLYEVVANSGNFAKYTQEEVVIDEETVLVWRERPGYEVGFTQEGSPVIGMGTMLTSPGDSNGYAAGEIFGVYSNIIPDFTAVPPIY